MKNDSGGIKPRIATGLKGIFAASALFAMTACTSTNTRNTDLFEGPDDMERRVSMVQQGMSQEQVIAMLGIPESKLKPIGNAREFEAMFGPNAQLQGSIHDLIEGREFLDRLDVRTLTMREINERWTLSLPANEKKTTKGYDVTVYFVFMDGQLHGKPDIAYNNGIGGVKEKSILSSLVKDIVPMAAKSLVP